MSTKNKKQTKVDNLTREMAKFQSLDETVYLPHNLLMLGWSKEMVWSLRNQRGFNVFTDPNDVDVEDVGILINGHTDKVTTQIDQFLCENFIKKTKRIHPYYCSDIEYGGICLTSEDIANVDGIIIRCDFFWCIFKIVYEIK